jgi:hypothetical protein
MQIHKIYFPINTIDLQNVEVLIRLEQADTTQGRNVIIDNKRITTADEKLLSREVTINC